MKTVKNYLALTALAHSSNSVKGADVGLRNMVFTDDKLWLWIGSLTTMVYKSLVSLSYLVHCEESAEPGSCIFLNL